MSAEKRFYIHAQLKLVLDEQDVDDIMVSALEGGITYWADDSEVVGEYLGEWSSEQISRGGKLRIHVHEPFDAEETEWYELDMEKFTQGFTKFIENGGYDCISDGVVDCCQIDGCAADSIIQYALFGELVFG